jgi:uncharacterized protein with NRDE domain
MCLILFAYRTYADAPLIVAANRDEFHGRPSAAAHFWEDAPQVLAGRDLLAGGTWLGCTRTGRFAALTNFSHPDDAPARLSRGGLVQEFLVGADTASHYAHHIHGADYAGFNLLLFDGDELVYTSNKGTTDVLHPGFYGLSNAELGAEWPKCVQGAQGLADLTRHGDYADHALLELLRNSEIPPDEALPHRGRPLDLERRVAPCFIVGEEYGTRASTIFVLGNSSARFTEQSYLANGVSAEQVSFTLELEN